MTRVRGSEEKSEQQKGGCDAKGIVASAYGSDEEIVPLVVGAGLAGGIVAVDGRDKCTGVGGKACLRT